MKIYSILLHVSLLCVISLSSPIKKELPNVNTELINEELETIIDYEDVTVLPPHNQRATVSSEVIVSKDNVIPLLRTIILATTHKKDPSYKEILKMGGSMLLKFAEKKVGDDKHMKGLLKIIKKHAIDFNPKSSNQEEEDLLGELAEEYLRKHKFRLLFPESLLLHQPEMEVFVNKMKDIGVFEGRQMSFDFGEILNQITNITSHVRSSFTDGSLFENFNLANIRNSFSTMSSTLDGYLPSIRNAVGIGGLSMSSITALAAAGALISAPFFLSNFRSAFREEEDNYYLNRRVSTGGFPPEQLVGHMEGGPMIMAQPEWLNNYNPNEKVYSPKKNLEYSEPSFSLYGSQNYAGQEIQPPNEDQEYSKYLNEYNQWLEQYHNAVNQQSDRDEHKDYYKRYKEWYSQYYKEQFGEQLPDYDKVSPSAYEENNNIPNMLPPPQPIIDSEPAENIQSGIYYAQEIPSLQTETPDDPTAYEIQSPNVNSIEDKGISTSFQVIKMDPVRKVPVSSQALSQTGGEQLPTPSSLIANDNDNSPQQVSNHQVYYQRANPRPVYIPNQQDINVSPTKKVEPTVIIFKKKITPSSSIPKENNEPSVKVENRKDSKSDKDVYTIAEQVFGRKQSTTSRSQPKETKKVKSKPVYKPNKIVVEKSTPVPQVKKIISLVTSGVFKTSPQTTPKSATTPIPYFQDIIRQSVRVVTSKSVETPAPIEKEEKAKNQAKKKITLTDLLKKNEKKYTSSENTSKDSSPKIEKRKDNDINSLIEGEIVEDKLSQRISVPNTELPVYALDPFYGPRLSRTDAIFHQLNIADEHCREQVVCNMYKNPEAFTPLSDFLSRQLTVTYDQLTRPNVNDERILRFFRYLRAARAGQDGYNCSKEYPKCYTDTAKLSYKPIVSAYNKVSLLMNSSH